MVKTGPQNLQIPQLIHDLEQIHSEMLDLVTENLSLIDHIHEDHQFSAHNLLHYLALRSRDIRDLQERLAALGLSSLGHTEARALSAVRTVIDVLFRLNSTESPGDSVSESSSERAEGRRLLERNTEILLGPAPKDRRVRIMVTMPSEAATCYELVRDLLVSGMDCMRINCAHDGQEAWSGMIRNLRQAEQETGKRCKVAMDLAGPKLRTGSLEAGPGVVKWRPQRDAFGRVEVPARIWLTPAADPETPPSDASACLPVSERFLSLLDPDTEIRFRDARGSKRSMRVCEASGKSRWAECGQTAYVTEGTELTAKVKHQQHRTQVGVLPAMPRSLLLKQGDTLILTRSLEPGRPAEFGEDGHLISPARIGVTLPEFFNCVQPGEPVWLDDGMIGGTISAVEPDQVRLEITQAREGGDKLGAQKGINVPGSDLKVTALTEDDLGNLQFIATHADILGSSFVRTEEDVRDLHAKLAELDATDLMIVLKIETRQGFENLPRLLLEAMRRRGGGVMIARGDLAVECGFERMAEMQEQILWISEAAHVPVIWATQVLESLAKSGIPSRSEITDAAMGQRAECVMLNKGPYLLEAVKTLGDIVCRMEAHQEKKSATLRKLGVAAEFSSGAQS